jgi:hypothetical protein
MPSKSAAAELFRRAVSAGAFLEAQQYLELYRHEVEASWKATTSSEDRQAISTEVSAVLEWARRTTLSARSHAQRKLILLGREGAYAPSIPKNQLHDLKA